MRLAGFSTSILVALSISAAASAQAPSDQPPNPEDLLGNLVVEAGGTRSLPKVAVLPSLASDIEDVTLSAIIRRDLDLCGEFELLPSSAAPEGLYLADTPIDVKAWSGKGVEALVKVNGKHLPNGKAELRAEAILLGHGTAPAFEKRVTIDAAQLRVESHRLADLVIGALTGQNGSFASHMTFSSGSNRNRSVYSIDADGNNAKLVTPADRVAIASAFGPHEELFYTASIDHNEFAIYSTGGAGPLPQPVKGSVYSLAFSKDRTQVALSIGVGSTVQVFLGPDTATAKLASPVAMAIEPTFSPSGKLAFAGAGRWSQRIYVDGKPISPDGVFASAPTFCNNPNGVRVVFTAGSDRFADLVSTSERGGGLSRLTQNQGRNAAPACSPDGRLVAFFSTRTSGEGPGLYIMRLDGGRPKRVSSLLGDTLRWDPLPPRQEPEPKPAAQR